MGRTKALVFSWALAGAAVTAHAAEPSPLPPAPPLEEPELRGSLAEDSGFYMRFDAGVAKANASGLRSTSGDGGALASLGAVEGPISLGDAAILGIGAGYQFNPWLRANVTGEYRPGADYRAGSNFQYGGEYSGTVKTGLFLANAYVDFGNWFGFTPYVGAGLGAAAWQTSSITFGLAHNASGANFAWDVTAGVAYHLLPNLLIDVSYRYVNMGSFKTGAQSFNVGSNDLRIGLRWMAIGPPAPPVVDARY